jgi:hypothetical protein
MIMGTIYYSIMVHYFVVPLRDWLIFQNRYLLVKRLQYSFRYLEETSSWLSASLTPLSPSQWAGTTGTAEQRLWRRLARSRCRNHTHPLRIHPWVSPQARASWFQTTRISLQRLCVCGWTVTCIASTGVICVSFRESAGRLE